VNAFKKHFELHYSEYVNHIEKCAVVVSSAALATTFQALITTIVRDAKDLVCVTDKIEVAHAFFIKSKVE
jgi:superoxide dismutase